MRKLVIVGVVAGVAALGALVPGFRRTAAQPAPAPADSVTAPKLSVADSSNLRGPRQLVVITTGA